MCANVPCCFCFCFDSCFTPSGCEVLSHCGFDLHFHNDMPGGIIMFLLPGPLYVFSREVSVHTLDCFFLSCTEQLLCYRMCPCTVSKHRHMTYKYFHPSIAFFFTVLLMFFGTGKF